MIWHAALDLSGAAARVAVRDEQTGIAAGEAALAMRGRDAAQLAPWVLENLAAWGVEPGRIERWTVGSGPGSFTGMRLAAAFVSGLVYDRPTVRTRCVPTAVALAEAVPADGAVSRAVLFDGRNHEILVYGMRREGAEWVPAGWDAILNQEQAEAFFAATPVDGLVALSTELDAIGRVAPETVLGRVRGVTEVSLLPLLRSTLPFDNDLTRLVYLRPAVFTK